MFLAGATKHSSTFTGSETAANLNSANAKTVTVKAKWKSNCNDGLSFVGSYKNFDYTGSVQTFNACAGRTYKLEVWGGEGGIGQIDQSVTDDLGGLGGYSYGTKSLSEDTTIYVVVGGRASGYIGQYNNENIKGQYIGGYNGGGSGLSSGQNTPGGGGGATHMATRTGLLSSLSSYKSSVLIVAGGGGGGGDTDRSERSGGSGGGMIGGAGTLHNNATSGAAAGGTQSSGASFGKGGDTNSAQVDSPGAGGGGYYGGYASTNNNSGGGGGSGYIGGVSAGRMYQYSTGCTSSTSTATYTVCISNTGHAVANAANTGNGYARITRSS